MKKSLEPWQLGRFVKTLAYFRLIPILSDQVWFQSMLGNPLNREGFSITGVKIVNGNLLIFNFRESGSSWGAIDDVVMGGVSESSLSFGQSGAIFSGVVSTANSGGFASVRTPNFEPPLDLSAYDGIELRLKGDGQRYKFLVRGETQWDGIAFSTSVDTELEMWQTVRLPFGHMRPIFRSKTVPNAQLDRRKIYAFQIMLSKFEYDGGLNPRFRAGGFQMQLESISAYSSGTGS